MIKVAPRALLEQIVFFLHTPKDLSSFAKTCTVFRQILATHFPRHVLEFLNSRNIVVLGKADTTIRYRFLAARCVSPIPQGVPFYHPVTGVPKLSPILVSSKMPHPFRSCTCAFRC